MEYDIDFIRTLWRSAEALHNLGFNITAIKDKSKAPYHKWRQYLSKEQSVWEAVNHQWFKMSGIGAVTGIKSLFCLDFDKCDLSNIPTFLQMLGLPPDYRWVVISGSGKGFHIWFTSDYLQACHKAIGNSVIVYRPKKTGHFNQIELRLNCHVVLPPSKSANGGQYRFLNPNDLSQRPAELDYEKTVKQFLEEVGEVKPQEKQAKLFKQKTDEMEAIDKVSDFPKLTRVELLKIVSWYARELKKQRIDITANHHKWLRIAYALAYEFGEAGRSIFHEVSSAAYPGYSYAECDLFYSEAYLHDRLREPEKERVTIGTFFKYAHEAGLKYQVNGNK